MASDDSGRQARLSSLMDSAGLVVVGEIVEEGAETLKGPRGSRGFRYFIVEIRRFMKGSLKALPPQLHRRFPILWEPSRPGAASPAEPPFAGTKGECYLFFLDPPEVASTALPPRIARQFAGYTVNVQGTLPFDRLDDVISERSATGEQALMLEATRLEDRFLRLAHQLGKGSADAKALATIGEAIFGFVREDLRSRAFCSVHAGSPQLSPSRSGVELRYPLRDETGRSGRLLLELELPSGEVAGWQLEGPFCQEELPEGARPNDALVGKAADRVCAELEQRLGFKTPTGLRPMIEYRRSADGQNCIRAWFRTGRTAEGGEATYRRSYEVELAPQSQVLLRYLHRWR